MSWTLAALQVVLAGTFFLAAIGKLLRSDEFVSALRLSYLPEGLARSLAIVIPVVETGLAGWLMLAAPTSVSSAFAASLAVLTIFTLWMGWVRVRRLRVRCGCFGPDGGEVGTATIGRNLGLLAVAGLGWLAALNAASALPGPSLLMATLAVALGLGIALLAALRFAWPHFSLTEDQLRRGGAAGE